MEVKSDRTRAGYVRAFLGQPRLVILESPVQGLYQDMVPALLNRVAEICDQGGAAIWLTRSRLVWDNPSFPATRRPSQPRCCYSARFSWP